MRRGIVIAFGLLMLFSLVTACFADAESTAQTVYSVNLRNNSGEFLDSLIPVATIRPNVDKLVGYDCVTLAVTGGSTETWVSMFDSTDSLMSGEVFGEKESNASESIHDDWPRGKKVANGVAVRQGAFTDLQIFFIRK